MHVPQDHHPSNVKPQCTAIEPLRKLSMCTRTVGHEGLHRAVEVDGDGTTIIEWAEHWRLFAEQMRKEH